MSKKFYITTPIYYVNGVPHVGTATTTLICDALARFHKLAGEEVFFLTGTDEHAQKVANAAAEAGVSTQEFVDRVSQHFVRTWQFLGIDYDRFIRTSEQDHKEVVSEVFRRLQATGDIFVGPYEGWYSVSDETFYRDTDVIPSPTLLGVTIARESGSTVERVTQENYYFRLSAYGDRLLNYITDNPDFLQPDTRRNEVIAFIQDGLRDVPVSRRNTGWGIPVPGDPASVVYVWFDALINYLTATGWPAPGYEELWPADIHMVGKEIYTRFHATLWPAMLMGLGLPLPGHVIGHGWWLVRGEKGSKSKGNIPTSQEAVRQIMDISGAEEAFAIDAHRYYLLRDISYTGDAEYGAKNLIARYNGELANNLGNLLNRSVKMLHQFCGGIIPETPAQGDGGDLARSAGETAAAVEQCYRNANVGAALENIEQLVALGNKAIGSSEPWKRAKEGDQSAVDASLYSALELLRIVSVLLDPVMPKAAAAIRAQLGIAGPITFADALQWGLLRPGSQAGDPIPIFPRADPKLLPKEEVKEEMTASETTPNKPAPSTEASPVGAATTPTANTAPPLSAPVEAAVASVQTPLIAYDDFAKVQLRVAQILTAEPVPKTTKLLRLTIDVGEDAPRQLVAGIAESYAPESLPGRKIVIVANLQPATIRGVKSNGMLVAATGPDGKAILLAPDDPTVPNGSKIK